MSKDTPFEPANHLLDNPDALRQQVVDDGFLYFRFVISMAGLLRGQTGWMAFPIHQQMR